MKVKHSHFIVVQHIWGANIRRAIPIGATLVVGALAIGISIANADSGFSHVEPVGAGVNLKVLATAGDQIKGYTLFGVPDGTEP
ncbi:MAG: hypothetical protein Q7L55_10600 [Actinomycetota bacterium]|nr:hypothetical protein [Actinomycetota bacterium]